MLQLASLPSQVAISYNVQKEELCAHSWVCLLGCFFFQTELSTLDDSSRDRRHMGMSDKTLSKKKHGNV